MNSVDVPQKIARAQHLAIVKTAPCYVMLVPYSQPGRDGLPTVTPVAPAWYCHGLNEATPEGLEFWIETLTNVIRSLKTYR